MPSPDQMGSPFPAARAMPLSDGYGGKIMSYDELPIHALGDDYAVEGSGTVTRLPVLPSGITVFLRMIAAPTFKNSTRLICPNGVDYVAAAGDLAIARSDGDGVWRLFVNSASGAALIDRNLSLTSAQRLQVANNISNPPQCGRLTYVSATALAFKPFNGDLIKINGSIYRIPAAGIAGLANTSVFVNGVGASNLATSTVYWVYAFVNSGVVTGHFVAIGHATSATAGNEGVETQTSDDTRTLIGLVYTNASSQFEDIKVTSWFNRRGKVATLSQSLAAAGNTTGIIFVTWADESFEAGTVGYLANSGANVTGLQNRIDFSSSGPQVQGLAASNQIPLNSTFVFTAAEGARTYDAALSAGGGTSSLAGTSYVRIRG